LFGERCSSHGQRRRLSQSLSTKDCGLTLEY
jgi:hypothetical protein